MRGGVDFSSWQGLLSTLLGLVLVLLVMVGIRLVVMQTVQARRERENRQINERLKTLIAAYKTLGGSFTGNLDVDPAHRRDRRPAAADDAGSGVDPPVSPELPLDADLPGADRRRRVRDAVEAALSDVILLGTEEQVGLAVAAANDLVAGRTVETGAIVVSLRSFIREVLDLGPMPAGLQVPRQGPVRPVAGGARTAQGRGGQGGARSGGGGAGGGGGGGGGGGSGALAGASHEADDPPR